MYLEHQTHDPLFFNELGLKKLEDEGSMHWFTRQPWHWRYYGASPVTPREPHLPSPTANPLPCQPYNSPTVLIRPANPSHKTQPAATWEVDGGPVAWSLLEWRGSLGQRNGKSEWGLDGNGGYGEGLKLQFSAFIVLCTRKVFFFFNYQKETRYKNTKGHSPETRKKLCKNKVHKTKPIQLATKFYPRFCEK